MSRLSLQDSGLALALMAVLCLGCTSTQTPPISPASQSGSQLRLQEVAASAPAHHFEHVLIVVLENQNFAQAAQDPDLKLLAQQGTSFEDFHGLFHPSYANYLSMVSGALIQTPQDRQITVNQPTIGDRLEEQGKRWKNYAEDYPGHRGDCFLDSGRGKYARKHVPFLSFARVQKERCDNVVSATELMADLKAGSLPEYAYYSPNLDNDGHDPVLDPATGLKKGAAGLKRVLDPILADPALRKGLLVVVTYDESQGSSRDNHIYTVFLGDMVKPRNTNHDVLNHFNVLRTIEDNFGLKPLADGDGKARPITDVWQ
jgi:hypothetical protein